jgi:hypothetical protein
MLVKANPYPFPHFILCNHTELADKIVRLLEDRDLSENFIENGYESLKQLAVERMGKNTVEVSYVYNKVISEKILS